MSNTVEKSFTGFVKVVIGATGLLAMGAVVAGGALVKGFKEGAKAVRESLKDQEPDTEKKTAADSEETAETDIHTETESAT